MADKHTLDDDEYPIFNGMKLPPFPRYKENPSKALAEIKDFPSRSSDIFICASLKSGSHWLYEIISMLLSGKLEYSKDCVINSHIDLADLDMLKKKTDPRILHTHLPYSYLPAKHKENRYKIVFMLRNPKDREVSMFHFALGKSKRTPVDLPWSVYFEQIAMSNAEVHLYGGWYKYTREWETQLRLSHGNIHVVYFEDLKRNFEDTVHKLACFLEVERDGSFYRDLEKACNINSMKQNKYDDTILFDSLGRSTLYRKGEIGDWKHHFTVAQNEEFDEQYKREMEGSELTFTYE